MQLIRLGYFLIYLWQIREVVKAESCEGGWTGNHSRSLGTSDGGGSAQMEENDGDDEAVRDS